MIKTEMGMVRLDGSKAELLADFACIARAMFHDVDGINEAEVEEALENARHPERIVTETLEKSLEKSFKEMLKDLLKEVEEDGKKTC